MASDIERMAASLVQHTVGLAEFASPYSDLDPRARVAWENDVGAALAPLREPSPDLVEAVARGMAEWDYAVWDDLAETYDLMPEWQRGPTLGCYTPRDVYRARARAAITAAVAHLVGQAT